MILRENSTKPADKRKSTQSTGMSDDTGYNHFWSFWGVEEATNFFFNTNKNMHKNDFCACEFIIVKNGNLYT